METELARNIFDHARDIILVIDSASGMIVDANLAACQAYGYSRAQLCALTIYDLRVDQPASVSAQMTAAHAGGILFETVHRRSDGSTFPVEVSSRGGLAGSALLFSVVRDITDRQRHEQERADLLATTESALAQREEFLAIASHELRSPVVNVDLQLQSVLRTLARLRSEDRLAGDVKLALGEVRRLSELIATLLDAQQAKQPLPLARTELDLGAVIGEVCDRFRARAEQVGCELITDLAELPGRWDRLRVEQIIRNLVSNALKYGAGRPVHVVAWSEPGVALTEVCDHGIGISEADARRIFDRFERAVPTSYGGLGLGLYIAKQAAEAHGGTITLTSAPGAGTTFRVTLPR